MSSIDRHRSPFGQDGAPAIKRFKLLDPINPGVDYAAAKLYGWTYKNDSAGKLEARSSRVRLYDPTKKLKLAKDTIVWAIRMPDAIGTTADGASQRGRWELLAISGTTPLYHFALTAALANNSSATAVIREWDGAAWQSTGDSITVYDFCKISPGSNSGAFGTAWLNPDSGRYEVIELPQSANTNIVWAKSLTLWHNATGNGSYVDCHLVTDKDGGTEVLDGDGNPIPARVYLPRPNKMRDPNVRGEKTIAAELDANGIYTCVSDYLDDAIGTVKMWIGNDTDVAEGWRIYSTAEGKFPVGVTSSDPDIPATAPGATGGRKKHKHPDDGDATVWNTDPAIVVIADHPATLTGAVTLNITGYGGRQLPLQSFILYGNGYVETEAVEMSITGGGVVDTSATKCNAGAGIIIANHAAGVTGDGGAGSGTASGTTASATTGITVAEHGTHAHNISSSGRNDADLGAGIEGVIQSVSATTAANASGTNVTQHSVTDPGHVHTFSSVTVTISAHNHTTPALSHSITEAPHLHTVEVAQIAARLSLNPNPHAHEVSVSRIAEQMVGTGFVTLPGYEPIITPNPHYHTIPMMTHETMPHFHHIPDTPLSKHIPPFFGVYFIERFE